jgi:hypothetical protein
MARNRMGPDAVAAAQNKIDRQMVDGVGGLEFTAQSPPGIGRLIRIPFYELTAFTGFDALFGQAAAAIIGAGTASAVSPAIRMAAPLANLSATNAALLQTPQISWATLRIVGFESNINEPLNYGTPPMEVCFSDFKVGGGANLFVHEDFAPASIYLMGQDSFAGLRDYPILKSPNRAEVAVQGVGFGAGLLGEGASAPLIFSCNLVCEILVDDNYGAHIPGAYARPGALVRQGGSFV